MPAYQLLNTTTVKLDSITGAFNQLPNTTNLANLQSAFKDAYQAWQACSPFGFGPADQQSLNVSFNTFPTDTAAINANIASGSYDLGTIANLKAKGFPAIDYLLFGIAADNNSIVQLYTTDSKASGRKQYLAALSAEIKSKTGTVLTAWQSGNYINTFINAAGTDVGSSLGQLVNGLAYDMDVIKNYEIGIPLGKQSMGTLFPQKVQAYYSAISARLTLLHLQTMQNIYLGKGAPGDGTGMDDYLVQINAQYNGGSLNDAIKAQFGVATGKVQALADPLSATIQNNTTAVNAAYTEIQKLLVLLKTDMPSAMGVLITYADNDGD